MGSWDDLNTSASSYAEEDDDDDDQDDQELDINNNNENQTNKLLVSNVNDMMESSMLTMNENNRNYVYVDKKELKRLRTSIEQIQNHQISAGKLTNLKL